MNDADNQNDIEQALMGDIKSEFGELGKVMISSKLAEQKILHKSVTEGGPGSTLDAIVNTLDYLKIGIRVLSLEAGVKRNALKNMLEGRTEMPQEVFDKIYASFAKRRPDMFNSSNV